jgi:HEAT repeat protein
MNWNSCRLLGLVVLLGSSLSLWGAEAELEQAFRYLATYTWSQSREPLNAVEEAIQSSAGDAVARKQLETRLAAVLRSGAPFPAKQYACRKLSQIGTADAIPALAPLLVDPALSHPARLALERISHPRAVEALRDALPKAEGNAKLGIVNSLGVLKDTAAVGPLTALLANPDLAIAGAAASALGHIGTVEAAKGLEQSRSTRDLQPLVTQAWLLAAGRLLQEGQRAEAARIYAQLHSPEEAAPVRLAAFEGLVTAQPERAFDLLAAAIAGDNDQERRVAALAIGDRSATPDVTRFVKGFKTYSPNAQVALLEAFRFRHEAAARPAALAAAESSSDIALRLAGLRALAVIGTAADVPMLARRAAGEGQESPVAAAALASLPDPKVDAVLITSLPASAPEVTVKLFDALVARGTKGAGQSVAARLTDASELVRTAALNALAEFGGASQVPAVIAWLKTAANDGHRETAQNALAAVAGRAGPKCVEDILKELEGARTETRIALLRALGIAGGPKALAAVRADLNHGDARVKDAAFRVLVDWSSVDAGPDLLRLARTSAEPNWRVLAFRGYVRLCREGDAQPEKRIRLLAEAMKNARDAEEKRLVIAALGEQRGPDVLPILSPCFEDPALAQETCLAVVTVAINLEAKEKHEVVPALKRVLEVSASQEVREKARTTLQHLGERPE